MFDVDCPNCGESNTGKGNFANWVCSRCGEKFGVPRQAVEGTVEDVVGKRLRFECVFARKACIPDSIGRPEILYVFKDVFVTEPRRRLGDYIWANSSHTLFELDLDRGNVVEFTAVLEPETRASLRQRGRVTYRFLRPSNVQFETSGRPADAGPSHAKDKCERCGKEPRVLKVTEQGQAICRTCWRELFPTRPKHLATPSSVEYLRKMGFDVPDDLTKDESDRLHNLNFVRIYGDDKSLPLDTPAEELERLAAIIRLRERGIGIDHSATLADTQAAEQGLQAVQHFRTAVAGVAHNNRDGTSRQEIISRCSVGERLRVKHEKDNPVDPNAVALLRQNGEQVGYLKADLAAEIVQKGAQGWRYAAVIQQIDGGETESQPRGAVVALVAVHPTTTKDVALQYVARLQRESVVK